MKNSFIYGDKICNMQLEMDIYLFINTALSNTYTMQPAQCNMHSCRSKSKIIKPSSKAQRIPARSPRSSATQTRSGPTAVLALLPCKRNTHQALIQQVGTEHAPGRTPAHGRGDNGDVKGSTDPPANDPTLLALGLRLRTVSGAFPKFPPDASPEPQLDFPLTFL